jgi:hypothetical protein
MPGSSVIGGGSTPDASLFPEPLRILHLQAIDWLAAARQQWKSIASVGTSCRRYRKTILHVCPHGIAAYLGGPVAIP